MLEATEISVRYGGVLALSSVSITVERGEVLGLIGPNGAGKTTFFNVLSGFAPVAHGRLHVDGQEATGWSSQKRFHAGIARTFQIPEIVTEATVLDNVLLGYRRGRGTGLGQQLVRSPAYRRREAAAKTDALELLDMVGLSAHASRTAGQLPLGEVRLMELARCLLSSPRVLLLDELASGLTADELNPLEVALNYARETLHAAVVLVEHNVGWVMRVVDRVHVLDQGATLTSGSPNVVRQDQRVIEAYLGTRHEQSA